MIKVNSVSEYDPYKRLLYEGGDNYLRNLVTTNYNTNLDFQQRQVDRGYMDNVVIQPLEQQLAKIDELKEDLIEENLINDEWIYPIETLEGLMTSNPRMDDIIISNPLLRRRIAQDRLKGMRREHWNELYNDNGNQYYKDIYNGVMNGVVHTPNTIGDRELGVNPDDINKAIEEDRYIVTEIGSSDKVEYYTMDELQSILSTYTTINNTVSRGKI